MKNQNDYNVRLQQVEAQLGTVIEALDKIVNVTVTDENGKKQKAKFSDIARESQQLASSQQAKTEE